MSWKQILKNVYGRKSSGYMGFFVGSHHTYIGTNLRGVIGLGENCHDLKFDLFHDEITRQIKLVPNNETGVIRASVYAATTKHKSIQVNLNISSVDVEKGYYKLEDPDLYSGQVKEMVFTFDAARTNKFFSKRSK